MERKCKGCGIDLNKAMIPVCLWMGHLIAECPSCKHRSIISIIGGSWELSDEADTPGELPDDTLSAPSLAQLEQAVLGRKIFSKRYQNDV